MTDPKARRLQFSLRSLLVLPVLLGLFLGLTVWGGWEVGIMVLPLMVAYGIMRRRFDYIEAMVVALAIYLLIAGLLHWL